MANNEKKIRDFFRAYVDLTWKNVRNAIYLSRANSPEHNLMVCRICCWLLEHKIPYYTELKLTFGTTPDIVVPTHIKPLIEVMFHEDEALFDLKKADKYPTELRNEVIFIDATKEFNHMDLM